MTRSRSELRIAGTELRVGVIGAVTFGALLASSTVLRPVRDALVLDGNPDQIPWLFTATFLVMLVVSPAWSAAIDRVGRRTVVPLAFQFFAVCTVGFAVIVALDVGSVLVGRVFYVWLSVFNMFVVSAFWSLLADLIGPEPARRLFGPIAAGGTIGVFVGSATTRLLIDAIGVAGVLGVSVVLLELAVAGVLVLRRRAVDTAPEARPAIAGPFAGFAQLVRSPYLLAIAAYVLCTATGATFLYLEQAGVARAALPDREARTEYFATIELWTSIGTIILQTLLARPLLRWVGPGIVLLLLPLAQTAGLSLVVLAPSLGTVVFAQVASRTLTHGLTRPARELLFTVVDPDEKYRAKNAIDTVGYRFGDVASAWLHAGLGAGSLALLVASGPLAAIWLALALVVGRAWRAWGRS